MLVRARRILRFLSGIFERSILLDLDALQVATSPAFMLIPIY